MSSGDFVTQALSATATSPIGTITGANQVILITSGFSGAAFTVSGTFTGTVSFFASADGGMNWFPCNVAPSGSSTPAISTTAAGLFRSNVSGYTHVAMTATALTSGTPTVSIHCSQSAAMLGGGGGGGAVSSLTTTGTSGTATLASGVLNIPQYGPGTPNIINFNASAASTTSTSNVSSGQGIINYVPSIYTSVLITYSFSVYNSTANVFNQFNIYRSPANAIPALGAAIGGSDVSVVNNRVWLPTASQFVTISGASYDTGLVLNTPYAYYVTLFGGIGSGTVNFSSGSTLNLQEIR